MGLLKKLFGVGLESYQEMEGRFYNALYSGDLGGCVKIVLKYVDDICRTSKMKKYEKYPIIAKSHSLICEATAYLVHSEHYADKYAIIKLYFVHYYIASEFFKRYLVKDVFENEWDENHADYKLKTKVEKHKGEYLGGKFDDNKVRIIELEARKAVDEALIRLEGYIK